MPDQPVRAYPEHYTPSDLDIHLGLRFEAHDGTVYQPPDMKLVAGTCGTWVFRIENQACDLEASAILTLIRFNGQIAYCVQTTNPKARDYCTLETDSQAGLKLITGRTNVNLLSILVESGVFRRGESCTVRIGDRRGGSVGSEVFWSATTGAFLLAVDVDGKGSFQGARGNPYPFRVVAYPEVKLLRLLGPTVARTGEPFALYLGVFDRNRNLVEDYEGHIQFDIPEGLAGLPPSCRFTQEDRGVKIFEPIRTHTPGIYRIGLHGDGAEGHFLSNPMVVRDQSKAYVYWGDVHAHGWGDSTMYLMYLRSEKLDPLSRHQQARRVGRFDFACPGAMSMDPNKREEVWEAYREACAQMDEPGRYVPFLSYEAHPKAGDRQVIFKNLDEVTPPSMRAPMEELDKVYGERDDVLLEVHIGGAPPQWDLYRPSRERFVEICSGFGCAEWLLQRALRMGYKPAICGASDLHLGLMGGPRAVETFRGRFGYTYPMNQRDAGYGTGPITAIIATMLHREKLWEAIQARHTYATSGARIYLQVTCNGVPAGSEVELENDLQISITCYACAPLDRVDLIVGEYCVQSWYPNHIDFEERISFDASDLPGKWVYVRVHQVDGEYAWSSPVWLRREDPLPPAKDLPRWNDEVMDLSTIGENEATRYLPNLKRYLEIEEDPRRFHQITPVGIFEQSVGRCALFYCYWGEERLPMSIRWFFEFEIPKIRYDLGWRDFGAYDELEWAPRTAAT